MRGRAPEGTRSEVDILFVMRGRFDRRTARSPLGVLLFACVLGLALASGALAAQVQSVQRQLPDLVPPPDDALADDLASGELTEAEYALERALAIYQPERARRLYGEIARPNPREGTLILRDLAARLPELSPARRAAAERILARPTDRRDGIHGYRAPARRVCGARMCFAWVTRTSDRPPLVDRNRNGVPDWVDRTRAVFGDVWRKEVGRFGYRAPKSDRTSRNRGPNGKLDVYIADIGAKGLYGYCTSDDPARNRSRSVSAYCVVDNDFARRQFRGSATGTRALRVTAAHEFFHAVQYGYDWLEDMWLMEGTAAWIEDEVYTRNNDNRQYLKTSPLSRQYFWYPLDYHNPDATAPDANYKYGVWIFWRYLSERYGRDVVKGVWRRADARTGARNEYSLRAVVGALAARGLNFADVMSDFGVANIFPALTYREGAAYPSPGFTQTLNVTAAGVVRTKVPLFHLSNDYYALVPSGLEPDATLTVSLELPPPVTSPRASVVVEGADGTLGRVPAVFDPASNTWQIVVTGFGSARRALLVLTNASTRYRCWQRSTFSCRGRPLDDVDFHFGAAIS
jgi:hypothetical protein